ncbi:hypothetical protein K505DRAFT_304579 [Melanomma pulvis-pyrius CBS 109.77]|uniref:Uncharacterized protein n=1 Tax=Melanomma pulvis-pyrius CBS 109.77 TaxID=1314802 RepID=A0A6A6XCE8_9PLEO|nr:hypothetical protein K505DRAFT_304579 [Melanomma pulvis-pyrius CBS 109.77]
MAKEEDISFSPREMEVLALAWQCMETEPKINMAKLAHLTGYTQGSASVTLGKIKRKMRQHAEGAGTSPTTPKKPTGVTKPKSGTKRPTATPHDTPSKKKGSAKPPRYDSDDDGEFANVKVKTEEGRELLRGADEFLKQPAAFRASDSGNGVRGGHAGHDGYYEDSDADGYGQ